MEENDQINNTVPENTPAESARINGSADENNTNSLPEEAPVQNIQEDPDTVPGLRENHKQAMLIGAALGVFIGILMFLIPNRVLEEGARLTISVILILLGPRLVQDKYKLDFTKGRYTMAGGLVLVLIIYILIGHPVN